MVYITNKNGDDIKRFKCEGCGVEYSTDDLYLIWDGKYHVRCDDCYDEAIDFSDGMSAEDIKRFIEYNKDKFNK